MENESGYIIVSCNTCGHKQRVARKGKRWERFFQTVDCPGCGGTGFIGYGHQFRECDDEAI